MCSYMQMLSCWKRLKISKVCVWPLAGLGEASRQILHGASHLPGRTWQRTRLSSTTAVVVAWWPTASRVVSWRSSWGVTCLSSGQPGPPNCFLGWGRKNGNEDPTFCGPTRCKDLVRSSHAPYRLAREEPAISCTCRCPAGVRQPRLTCPRSTGNGMVFPACRAQWVHLCLASSQKSRTWWSFLGPAARR